MKNGSKFAIPVLIAVGGVVAATVLYLRHVTIPVLEPAGQVGSRERQLMIFALWLSAIVVIPVFTMLATFAWRYRAGNKKAKYSPNFANSRIAETIWWLVPGVLILILSVVTWNSAHQLDPFRPLNSSVKPLTIQVVSLDWKWLFIYPQQHIATVNFVEFPQNTPVTFDVTSDTVMNSFWIPQLGGQIYAMPGMSTQVHLEASKQGSYGGSSANISGKGFAGMRFEAKAVAQGNFDHWVQSVKQSPQALDQTAYGQLAKPSTNNPAAFYRNADPSLYDTIVMKYMLPSDGGNAQ